MPVKRRRQKRRLDPRAELEAWATVFECEFDFFGEAAELTGLTEPVNVWPPEARPEAEKAWRAAIEEAWRRLGAAFLEGWQPTASRDQPWALETFGEPPCQ